MPTLAIDKGFLTDLAKLEKPVFKRVTEVFDEFDSATHTGLHLEKIVKARNPRFRSIRIDQFWRGIVLAPERGDVYTLLKVLPHDDAYDWARRSKLSVNAATGGIEIRDEAELDRHIPQQPETAPAAAAPLFANISDGTLTKLGIDAQAAVPQAPRRPVHRRRHPSADLPQPGQLPRRRQLDPTQPELLHHRRDSGLEHGTAARPAHR